MGSLSAKFLLLMSVLAVQKRSKCLTVSSTSKDPLVVVSGTNSTNITMRWKVIFDSGENLINMIFNRVDSTDSSKDTQLFVYSASATAFDSNFYSASTDIKVGQSGSLNFTIKDMEKQINNKDASPYKPLSTNYTYQLTVIAIKGIPLVQGKSEIRTFLYGKPEQLIVLNSKGGVLYVNKGQPVNITCTAIGNPNPHYEWRFKGKQLHSPINNNIVINNATLEDAGIYTCTAINSIGRESISVTLRVNYLMDANCGPKIHSVNDGDNVNLNCSAIGSPAVQYTWTVNNKVSQGPTTTFVATKSLNGSIVTCTARNSFGGKTCSKTLIILHYIGPASCTVNPDTVVDSNDITLTCAASGYPIVNYTWTVENSEVSGKVRTVKAVPGLNGAIVTCKAVNEFGTRNCTKTVIVHYKPYNVRVSPSGVVLNKEGSFNLTCSASSNPPGKYSWSFNGKVLSDENNKVLTKHGITIDDAGEYSCTVTNTVGSGTSYKAVVNVRYLRSCDQSYVIANQQCVSVRLDGFPVPTINCSPRVNLDVTTQGRNNHSLCGVKGDTVSKCIVANGVGSCKLTVSVLKRVAEKVVNSTFKCTSCIYESGLADRKSLVFNTLKERIENMLKLVYAFHKYVTSVFVIAFWPGSVIVEFQLKLIADVSDPLSPFKEAVCKQGGTLDGMSIDISSIQEGAYISPTTTATSTATIETTTCSECHQVSCTVLGVLFGVSLIFNFIFVGYYVWRRLKENKGQVSKRENIAGEEAGYMNTIALQEQPTSPDGQNVVQYEPVANERESTNTTIYQSISPHTDTYSSLSPSTKLPPKPAGITTSGIYQNIQAPSQQYQSLDSFSRV